MIEIKENLINILSEIKNLMSIDDKGAFVLPFDLRLKDKDFLKYCHFDVDWEIDSVSSEDLPDDFCSNAVKLVDLFRRKTVNLPYECMLFFDYRTGEIIYCFVGENAGEMIYLNCARIPDFCKSRMNCTKLGCDL